MELYTYLKIYPEFTRLYEYRLGYEDLLWFAPQTPPGYTRRVKPPSDTPTPEENRIRALRRSKTLIADFVICNSFDSFATFTFNGDKKNTKKYGYAVTNRNDIKECKVKMSKWLSNQRELHGSFGYLIVPEFHKDGKAIHFHALLQGFPGSTKYSGRKQNSRMVYNITSYKLGHSTLVKIGNTLEDKNKVSNYIRKYITKEMPYFPGKKRYWHSRGLNLPQKIQNPIISSPDRKTFEQVYQMGKMTVHRSTLVNFPQVIKYYNKYNLLRLFNIEIISLPTQLKLLKGV